MGTMTAQQIYDTFHSAAGTGMWQTAQDAANRLGEDMPALAADIKRLQSMMNAAWQGTAADVASQGAEPLALEYMNTADGLRTAQGLVGRQTGSFDTAANSVAPVPPEPTTVDVVNAALGAPDMQQQVSSYLSATQHNVDVYTTYHGASQYNTTNLPMDYGHLTVDNAGITTTEPVAPTPTGVALATPAGHAAPRTEPRPVSPRTTTATSAGARGQSLSGPITTSHGPIPVSEPPSAAQPPTMPSGVTRPGPVEPGAWPNSGQGTSVAGVPGGLTGLPGLSALVFDEWVAGGRWAGAYAGSGVLPVVDGSVGRAEPDVRAGRGAVGGQAPVEDAATLRVGAATAGSASEEPGFVPMSGMAARRREDDEECRISTFLEPDPNELFGSPERAVRPVIGE
jgi:hypothetical protein